MTVLHSRSDGKNPVSIAVLAALIAGVILSGGMLSG